MLKENKSTCIIQDEYVIYTIDTETTGLIVGENEIIELSGYRTFLSDPEKDEQKTWLIRALKPETIQDEALSINKHKKEDVLHYTQFGRDNYMEPDKAILDIEDWVNQDEMPIYDRVFAGQNPSFDFDHMVHLWTEHEMMDTFPFLHGHSTQIIDTKQLALFIDICLEQKRERYNLGSLVKAFGIKKEKAHKADADTRMTKDLLLKIINGCKKSVKENFKNDS